MFVGSSFSMYKFMFRCVALDDTGVDLKTIPFTSD